VFYTCIFIENKYIMFTTEKGDIMLYKLLDYLKFCIVYNIVLELSIRLLAYILKFIKISCKPIKNTRDFYSKFKKN